MSKLANYRLALLLVGCGFACQAYPYNNQFFASQAKTEYSAIDNTGRGVLFAGCSTGPNHTITFEYCAQSPCTNQGVAFAGTATSSSSINNTDSNGVNWYCWHQLNFLPAKAWHYVGGDSVYATAWVRTVDSGTVNWIFDNDYSQCPSEGFAALTNQIPCALAPTSVHNNGFVLINATGP